jgi:hypothetical protein
MSMLVEKSDDDLIGAGITIRSLHNVELTWYRCSLKGHH